MFQNNSLRITFNNPNGVFYPNQVVSGEAQLKIVRQIVRKITVVPGSVELKVVQPIKKARGLRLTVEGEAACKWKEGSGKNSTTYTGKEKYLHSITYLFGARNGENQEVQVGIHTYTFECRLPTMIPYTVEGRHGHVRYSVEANLDIPWAIDLQSERPFTVARCEDLNYFPEMRLPVKYEGMKTLCFFCCCCCCCCRSPFILKVRLPRAGFGLGETIPVRLEMINKSSRDVSSTELTLKRVQTFNSASPRMRQKIVKEKVTEVRSSGVRAGQTVDLEVLIKIPQFLMITNKEWCNVFQISYQLRIIAKTAGLCNALKFYVPITIGSVGITDGFQPSAPQDSVGKSDRFRPSAPQDSVGKSDRFQPSAPQDLPPSFDEAMKNNII